MDRRDEGKEERVREGGRLGAEVRIRREKVS